MALKRYRVATTLYGTRSLTAEQLFQLHREVSKAASLARLDDERWQENYKTGMGAARPYRRMRDATR